MNEATTKWIEALRSGKYRKGMEKLHTKDNKGNEYFCCLGVACNISNLATQEVNPLDKGPVTVVSYASPTETRMDSLPYEIRLLFGLRNEYGSFYQDNRTRAIFACHHSDLTSLARINDSGATFEQIAKIIELRPEGLF